MNGAWQDVGENVMCVCVCVCVCVCIYIYIYTRHWLQQKESFINQLCQSGH